MTATNLVSASVIALALITLVLLVYIAVRSRDIAADRGGRVWLLFGLLVLPVLTTASGLNEAVRKSSTTDFCMQCHEMHS